MPGSRIGMHGDEQQRRLTWVCLRPRLQLAPGQWLRRVNSAPNRALGRPSLHSPFYRGYFSKFGTLQFEVAYTVEVGSATGLSFVSDDIGGFHQYTEPDGTSSSADPDDLYVRWVQFAAFQPILRLHSDHGYRLPWEYDDTAKGPAEQFFA